MDKKEILSLFILTTIGKTINNDLGKIYEKMSWFGSIGDYQQYEIYSSKYGDEFIKLRNKLILDQELLESNIGPELWIENSRIKIPTVLWSKEDKALLYININTASANELATFWDMDLSKANMFIKKRNEIGFFKSFEEATQLGFNFN